MSETKDFYTSNIENLIEDLKNSINVVRKMIPQEIDEDLKDDKFTNACKGKKEAAEYVEWALNKINQLTKQLSGEQDEEKVSNKKINRAKEFAQNNQ